MSSTTVRRTAVGAGAVAVSGALALGMMQFAEAATAPIAAPATVLDAAHAVVPTSVTTTRTVVTYKRTAIPVRKVTDYALASGRTKVIRTGSYGKLKLTWTYTYRDGKAVARKIRSVKTVNKAHPRVIHVGAKSAASRSMSRTATGISAASLAASQAWANSSDVRKVKACESGGNYASQDAPYYGAYQFLTSTWLGMGGGKWGSRADRAPRWAQDYVAWRLWKSSGWSPWTCARITGVA